MGLRPWLCVVVVCAAILAGGCGGSGGGGSDSVTIGREAVTRLTDEWVSMYCSDALELLVFLVDTRDGTLAGDVSPEDAGRVLTFRAENFAGELNWLGRPDTPDGDTAASTIRDLGARENASADRIATGTSGKASKGLAVRRELVRANANQGLKAITDTTTKLGHHDTELARSI